MKTIKIVLVVNAAVQLLIGGVMVLIPTLMSRLIYIPEPNVFIQAIGSVAISIGILPLLCLKKIDDKNNRELIYATLCVLVVFNLGLSVFLGLSSLMGLVSWLGIAIHLPLMLVCIYALAVLRRT